MKIENKIFTELKIYDTDSLEKLIHATKNELNNRLPYKDTQIGFIYEKCIDDEK